MQAKKGKKNLLTYEGRNFLSGPKSTTSQDLGVLLVYVAAAMRSAAVSAVE